MGWVFMCSVMSKSVKVHCIEPWAMVKRKKEKLMAIHMYYNIYALTHTCSHSVYKHTYLRALAEISGALLPTKLIIMKLL